MRISLIFSLICFVYCGPVQSQEVKPPSVSGADEVLAGVRGDALAEVLVKEPLTDDELNYYGEVIKSACEKLGASSIDAEDASTGLDVLAEILYGVKDPKVSAAHIAFLGKLNWHVLRIGTDHTRHIGQLRARAVAVELSIAQFSNDEAQTIVETLRGELEEINRLISLLEKSNESLYKFANLNSVELLSIYQDSDSCR